jgi:hypothetical protein
MVLSNAKKLNGVFCCAYACKAAPSHKLGGLCFKHYRRRRKELDPVAERYAQFKSKSKARGIENSVTLDEFRSFAKRTGYIHVKGRRGQNATIDRICNVHGYHLWNMQLLTNTQNARKGNKSNGDTFGCPF